MVSTASLLGTQHLEEVVENKPASSCVVLLGKTLNGMPLLYVEDKWPRCLEWPTEGNGKQLQYLAKKTL